MKIVWSSLCNMCFSSSWSRIECKEVLSHVFINFNNSCFVSTSIEIVWLWENDNSISCSVWVKKHIPFLSWQFLKAGKGMPRLKYFRRIEMELVLEQEQEHRLEKEMEHPQDQPRGNHYYYYLFIYLFHRSVAYSSNNNIYL